MKTYVLRPTSQTSCIGLVWRIFFHYHVMKLSISRKMRLQKQGVCRRKFHGKGIESKTFRRMQCSGKVKSRGTECSVFESCSVPFRFFLRLSAFLFRFVYLFDLLLIVFFFYIYTFKSKDSIFMDKQSEFLSFPTI